MMSLEFFPVFMRENKFLTASLTSFFLFSVTWNNKRHRLQSPIFKRYSCEKKYIKRKQQNLHLKAATDKTASLESVHRIRCFCILDFQPQSLSYGCTGFRLGGKIKETRLKTTALFQTDRPRASSIGANRCSQSWFLLIWLRLPLNRTVFQRNRDWG